MLSVVVVLAVLWLETRSVRVLAFVGLHPAVVIGIVNGGHNDAARRLRGAQRCGARRATALHRGGGGGGPRGAGEGLDGVRHPRHRRVVAACDRRSAARFVSAAALTTAVGYLPAGVAALRTIAGSASRTSRASVWSPISYVLGRSVSGPALVAVALLAARWRCTGFAVGAAVPRGVGRDRGIPLRRCLRAAVVSGVGVAFGCALAAVVVGDARRRARRDPRRGVRALEARRARHAHRDCPRCLHRDRGVRRARRVRVRRRAPRLDAVRSRRQTPSRRSR